MKLAHVVIALACIVAAGGSILVLSQSDTKHSGDKPGPSAAAGAAVPPDPAARSRAAEGLQLSVEQRPQSIRVDLAQAFTAAIGFRPGTAALGLDGPAAVRRLARQLRAGQRYLILVSNDNYSASGWAGKAGFERAKTIRTALAASSIPEELLLVAGWESKSSDPGLLAIMASPGRVVIVPVLFAAPENGPAGQDMGRTVAFDSATARLTTARWVVPATAAPQDPVRVILPNPVAPAPGPRAPVPVAREDRAPAPAAPQPAPPVSPPPPTAPAPSPPAAVAAPPAAPEARPPAKVECAPAADSLDDFQPGGAIVPCGATAPARRDP